MALGEKKPPPRAVEIKTFRKKESYYDYYSESIKNVFY